MLDVPAVKQVAAIDEMVGVAGADSCAALLKVLEGEELQDPLLAVTV
jgi:hypothetical protein